MKWRYYFKDKEGKIQFSDEMPSDSEQFDAKLTVACLSHGLVSQNIIKNIAKFIAGKNCLVRVPVFEDSRTEIAKGEEKKEIEGQSHSYHLTSGDNPSFSYACGLSPQEACEVICSSIRDGFDIYPPTGGTGFSSHILYVFKYIIEHKDEFAGGNKIRIFGFSDTSTATLLHPFVQFVNAISSYAFKMPHFANALRAVKEEETKFKRHIIAGNEFAKKLKAEDLQDFVCLPIYGAFLYRAPNCIYPFTPPPKPYSLMIEHIARTSIDGVETEIRGLREFLLERKNLGQALPKLIELADITTEDFKSPFAVYEYGRLLTMNEIRQKYSANIANTKFITIKKRIARAIGKDAQKITDEEADKYIKEVINPFYLKHNPQNNEFYSRYKPDGPLFNNAVYENGRMLTIREIKEKFPQDALIAEKYQVIKKFISEILSENTEIVSDEIIDKYIEEKINPFFLAHGTTKPRFPNGIYENGEMVLLSKMRETTGAEYFGEKRCQEIKKIIAKKLNKKPEELSDEEADEYIRKNVHPFYQKFKEEIKKVADEFEIAFFEGGQKRTGHGFHNIIQPSLSRNKATRSGGNSFTIETELPHERDIITMEELERVAASKRQVRSFTIPITDKVIIRSQFDFRLTPLNHAAESYALPKKASVIFGTSFLKRYTTQPEEIRCFTIPNSLNEQVILNLTLEPNLLSGKFDSPVTQGFCSDSSPIIFLINNDNINASNDDDFEKNFNSKMKMLEKFFKIHAIQNPVYIADSRTLSQKAQAALKSVKPLDVYQVNASLTMLPKEEVRPISLQGLSSHEHFL